MSKPPDVARIAVCEDSRTYAEGLRRFLEHDADLRVVGTCSTGREALPLVRRLRPDLLVMDLELPDGSGVDAITDVMAAHPLPIVLLTAHAPPGSAPAAAALGAGALDVQPKSEVSLRDPIGAPSILFRRRIKRLARTRIRGARAPAATPDVPAALPAQRAVAGIAVGASTGGPAALEAVLRALPPDFDVPILVVQHITRGFLPDLVDWLGTVVRLPVRIVRDGGPIEPGVWFAADDAHLVIDRQLRTRLDREPTDGYHRPAVDVLFTSFADSAGARSAGVVLTGMGRDGADGMAAIRAAGGLAIAQSEATSAVYGMPRAAAQSGADAMLSPPEIGGMLSRLTRWSPTRV